MTASAEKRQARREYQRKYRSLNHDNLKDYKRKYWRTCPEQTLAKHRQQCLIQIERLISWVDQIEVSGRYFDGIAEDATVKEILYVAERRYT